MKRLTTDNPQGNFEKLMNFAYTKHNRVHLSYADGEDDIDLCKYVSKLAKAKGFDYSPELIMEDGLFDNYDDDFAVLYYLAVQAAELRNRLKLYEDKLGNGTLIELPLSIKDREKIEKAIDSLYLYRIFPIECDETCPKFQKEKNTCCQELCDIYEGKSNKYNPNHDWDYMCENCPLEIGKTEFTLKRYEEAVKLKQGKIEYQVKNLICFLTKEEAEAKLRELNGNG